MNPYNPNADLIYINRYIVQDLNKNPKLPYEDKSFDAVVCALSIDYLNKPLKVMAEVARVLRPGGVVAIIFSNRLFLTKVQLPSTIHYLAMMIQLVPF